MGWLAGVSLALALASSPADGAIVERVVAVVGERPILLSDLRHRAEPHVAKIHAETSSDAQRAALESELLRELLQRMIDERLEEMVADRAHVSVSSDEIDAALRQVAAAADVSVPRLLIAALRQGLTEQVYRDELRRQILEGKLVMLHVRARVRERENAREFEAAIERARKEWLSELRRNVYVEVRL